MSKRVIRAILTKWRFIYFRLFCGWLPACSEPVSVYNPIDVTGRGQSTTVNFSVPSMRDYLFAMQCETGEFNDVIKVRERLFGDINEDGVIVVISL